MVMGKVPDLLAELGMTPVLEYCHVLDVTGAAGTHKSVENRDSQYGELG